MELQRLAQYEQVIPLKGKIHPAPKVLSNYKHLDFVCFISENEGIKFVSDVPTSRCHLKTFAGLNTSNRNQEYAPALRQVLMVELAKDHYVHPKTI